MKSTALTLLLLVSVDAIANVPKCDVFLMGMRMQVNQKIDENTYAAVGKNAGYGQVGRVEYKGQTYSRLLVKTLPKNSFMKTNDHFKYNRSVVGWFNFVNAQEMKMENGFKADVLVLQECPDVHELIKKNKEDQKRNEEIEKRKLEEELKKQEAQEKARKAKQKKNQKEFESLYE